MNNIFRTLRIASLSTGAFFALLIVSSGVTHAAITSSMAVGSTGSDVTQLQQFLSTNSTIYPAGIVSGYYGALTKAAVTQFQVAYGIDQVGQVGPTTSAKINALMASGLGLDTTASTIGYQTVQQINPTSAVIAWTTSEPTRGQVFYAANFVESDETTGPYQLAYISGTPASTNGNMNFSNNQSIQLANLNPNTTYYYVTRAIDQSGNVTLGMVQSFQTN